MLLILALLGALAANAAGMFPASPARADEKPARLAQQTAVRLLLSVQHDPQRTLKGDLLPRHVANEPPGEVASIEVWGEPSRVVLRGYAGDIAFYVDQAEATTVIAKDVSIPQLMLPSASPRPRSGWLSLAVGTSGVR